jgi:ribonucleoside-diphosphate reductase alpha chain
MAEDRIPKFSEKKTSSHLPPWKSPSVRPSCGLAVHRHFSKRYPPFDRITENRRRDLRRTGKSIFEQKNAEFRPRGSLATKVCTHILRRRRAGRAETSVKQLIHRVTHVADRGRRDGYCDRRGRRNFYGELVWLCVNQFSSFNSPVWFNVGLHDVLASGSRTISWDPGRIGGPCQ